MQRKRSTPRNVSAMIFALTVKAHTYDELSAFSGLSMPTVRTWVNQLHDLKLVHIADYSGERGTKQHFAWGGEPDAQRPTPMTAAQRVAKMRQRKKDGAK